MADGGQVYRAGFAAGLMPDPMLTVDTWADAHRVLSPKGSAEPGPWRTSRTPYSREPMLCLSPASPWEEVLLMWAAQTSKTETGNNWIGFIIDHAPGPAMAVQPTVDLAKRYSKQRIAPLIESTPRLLAKVRDARERDSGNTQLAKEFDGGVLILTGANSAAGLRSMPARYLFLDEVDAYPGDVEGEGDPITLAEARQRTFGRRKKRLVTSTPTIKGRSKIEARFEMSDQRFYFVPCPHCQAKQVLKFGNLKWDKGSPRTARYACVECGALIENHQKTWMLERGEWRATKPGNGRIAGFHLSALYSPVGWLSWAEIAEQWEESESDLDKRRTFVNTVLAETWVERGDAPEWERIYERREQYPIGRVQRGGLFLTCGVDVQKDRIEWEVVAWGRGKESWSVDYGIEPGDTAGPEVWARLDALLQRTWKHDSGVELGIARMAVDSGYNTQNVYTWARQHPLTRVLAVFGSSTSQVLLGHPTAVDVSASGRKMRRAYKRWPVGHGIGKTELYGWLRLPKPTDETLAAGGGFPPGYCHFPEYPEEFFKQLTAEQLVPHKKKGGYTRLEWEVIPGRRNERLDCRVYARAAAASVGIDRFKDADWAALEAATAQGAGGKTAPKREQNGNGGVQSGPPGQPGKFIERRPGWMKRRT